MKKKLNSVNKQAKKIAEKPNIDNRIEKIHKSQAYIMVIDHKKGFSNNPSLSKKILDKINQRVIQEAKVNQWKNTDKVIAWFKSLPDKSCLSFVNFDIESSYPSISLNLFQQATDFAWEKGDITDTDISNITPARKTLLSHDGIPSVKQSSNEDSDVPMGSYDSVEVCELLIARKW